MKKILAIMLAVTMILCVLVSCKKDDQSAGNSNSSAESVEDGGRLGELGSRDFEGKSFNILDANDYPDMHVNYATEETQLLSNINEALYRRDLRLIEMYNLDGIKFTSITKAATGIDTLRIQILGGTAEYDMVISTAVGSTTTGSSGGTLASLAIQDMLRNLNEVNYLSLDKEWWSPLIYKNTLLNGKMYFTTGDIAPSLYQAPAAMYVNMDLFSQYHKDVDIFEVVESGEWTFSKLNELTVDISQDLNEDNTMSATEDFFGLALQMNDITIQDFVIGAGAKFSKIENNILSVDLRNQTLSSAIDGIKRLYPTMKFNYGANGDQQDIINVTFKQGKSVFLAHHLESAMFHLRDMEGDYAVVPYPKATADQEQYLSHISNWVDCFVAVPSSVSDEHVEFVGFMMEAMAAYSNENLRPFIYESVLKYQRLNDPKSSAMIDVIMDGIVIDYAVVYDIGSLGSICKNVVFNGSSLNLQAASAKNTINQAIKTIMEAHGVAQ